MKCSVVPSSEEDVLMVSQNCRDKLKLSMTGLGEILSKTASVQVICLFLYLLYSVQQTVTLSRIDFYLLEYCSFSGARFHEEAGMNHAREWRQRKLKYSPVENFQERVTSLPSHKVSTVAGLQEYVAAVTEMLPQLLSHYGSRGHRNLRKQVPCVRIIFVTPEDVITSSSECGMAQAGAPK